MARIANLANPDRVHGALIRWLGGAKYVHRHLPALQ